MKRRKFIQASLVSALAAPLATASERLYGTPTSLANVELGSVEKFVLPLSRAGVPQGAWGALGPIHKLVESVLSGDAEARAFKRDPAKFLRSHGLDASDSVLTSETFRLLSALTDPAVKNSLRAQDHDATLGLLRAAGFFSCRQKSDLSNRISTLFQQNVELIRDAVGAGSGALSDSERAKLAQVLQESGVGATEVDLAALTQIIDTENSVMACTVVAICAAAVVVAVLVSNAVGVVAVVWAVAATAVEIRGNEAQSTVGTFAKLDPNLMSDTERTIRLARLSGSRGLEIHAIKKLIAEETEAVLVALKDLKLVRLTEQQLPLATRALARYAEKTIGF